MIAPWDGDIIQDEEIVSNLIYSEDISSEVSNIIESRRNKSKRLLEIFDDDTDAIQDLNLVDSNDRLIEKSFYLEKNMYFLSIEKLVKALLKIFSRGVVTVKVYHDPTTMPGLLHVDIVEGEEANEELYRRAKEIEEILRERIFG